MRQAIFGLFHMVYQLVKRYGCFGQLAADAETAALVGGQVAPAYRSQAAAREIAHAIARPIRATGGEQVVNVSPCHSPTVPLFTDVITQRNVNTEPRNAEPATETHVSQGMTVCAYCVTVSMCHAPPHPHPVISW